MHFYQFEFYLPQIFISKFKYNEISIQFNLISIQKFQYNENSIQIQLFFPQRCWVKYRILDYSNYTLYLIGGIIQH